MTLSQAFVRLTPMKKGSFFWILLAVVSIFLQFYQLGERSLWEDEAQIALKTDWGLKEILHFQKNVSYNIILSFWSHFGKDEFWLRIPSALFALFTLVALYELGKKLFSREVALLATGLLATSPFFLLESRQVKMYTLVLFLSLTSIYFLMLFFENGRRGSLLSHFGLSFMAFLTHYMFIPLYLVQLFFVFTFFSGKGRTYVKRYFLTLCAISPFFLISFLNLFTHLEALQWFYVHPKSPETLLFPGGVFGKVAFVFYLFLIGPTTFPWKWGWVLAGCFFSIPPLLYSLKGFSNRSLKFISLAFVIPVLLLSSLRNAQPHYSLVSLPFYVLLIATGLYSFQPLGRALFLAGLILVNAYGLANYFLGHQYLFITYLEPYREVVGFVQSHFEPGDYLLHTQMNPSFNYYFYYFYEKRGAGAKLHFMDRNEALHLMDWEEVAKKLPVGTKRIWYIERSPGQFMENKFLISDAEQIYRENLDFRSSLDRHFKRVGRWGYLKDPDIEQKKKFLKKFYMEERIAVSLYSLLDPP